MILSSAHTRAEDLCGLLRSFADDLAATPVVDPDVRGEGLGLLGAALASAERLMNDARNLQKGDRDE